MKITLHQPLGTSEKGKRKNNEDSIYPPQGITPAANLFMVCDGVGGNAKGEVAGELACILFAAYIEAHPARNYDAACFSAALKAVEEGFDHYVANHPEAKGMATTLTLALFHDKGVSLAHCGDSRIYHVRDQAICYQSRDHSFVNFLLANGDITEEEAAVHPKRNVIMRAIGGSQQPTKLDVHTISHIEAGDYFFLCTDGVLESLSNENLIDILSSATTNEDKQRRIASLCEAGSNDNYSFYLLQVASVEQNTKEKPETSRPESLEPTALSAAGGGIKKKIMETCSLFLPFKNNSNPKKQY